MGLALAFLIGGTVVLALGAGAAVKGATALALARGLSPFVLGALLFGVDPESLAAALLAAGRGETSLAAGEAFGTIVFLFSAGFGAALVVSRKPVLSPGPSMVLAPAVTLAAGALALFDSLVTRLEAGALLVIYAMYVSIVVWEGRQARARGEHIRQEATEEARVRIPPALLLAGGLVLVYAGAHVLVEGGLRVLDRTSLAAGFVGAAIIGALAAADEVFLEVLPVRRGMPGLATGNLFGTAAAFSTGVLGVAALVRPLEVDSAAGFAYVAAATLYAMVAIPFLLRGKAGRLTGIAVLAAYGAWLAVGSQQ